MQLSQLKEFDALDVLSVMSFWISLMNLDENLSQTSASDLIQTAVKDIHEHLELQDNKLDEINKTLATLTSAMEVVDDEKD